MRDSQRTPFAGPEWPTLKWLLRVPAEAEVGCLIPLAIAAAVLVGAGVLIGTRYQADMTPSQVTVGVIDDGALGGPRVLSTQVVPLR